VKVEKSSSKTLRTRLVSKNDLTLVQGFPTLDRFSLMLGSNTLKAFSKDLFTFLGE